MNFNVGINACSSNRCGNNLCLCEKTIYITHVINLVGPIMIYEYCEKGPLKDYLQWQSSNVTLEVQDKLFRFGLDIAKGMEYLASKKVKL